MPVSGKTGESEGERPVECAWLRFVSVTFPKRIKQSKCMQWVGWKRKTGLLNQPELSFWALSDTPNKSALRSQVDG